MVINSICHLLDLLLLLNYFLLFNLVLFILYQMHKRGNKTWIIDYHYRLYSNENRHICHICLHGYSQHRSSTTVIFLIKTVSICMWNEIEGNICFVHVSLKGCWIWCHHHVFLIFCALTICMENVTLTQKSSSSYIDNCKS